MKVFNTLTRKKDEFVPINEEKMHKFPDGIAHFLEHKMFEKEDGHVLEKFPFCLIVIMVLPFRVKLFSSCSI